MIASALAAKNLPPGCAVRREKCFATLFWRHGELIERWGKAACPTSGRECHLSGQDGSERSKSGGFVRGLSRMFEAAAAGGHEDADDHADPSRHLEEPGPLPVASVAGLILKSGSHGDWEGHVSDASVGMVTAAISA